MEVANLNIPNSLYILDSFKNSKLKNDQFILYMTGPLYQMILPHNILTVLTFTGGVFSSSSLFVCLDPNIGSVQYLGNRTEKYMCCYSVAYNSADPYSENTGFIKFSVNQLPETTQTITYNSHTRSFASSSVITVNPGDVFNVYLLLDAVDTLGKLINIKHVDFSMTKLID